MAKKKKSIKKITVRKPSKKTKINFIKKIIGRKPSNKTKLSKVRKLIRLAKQKLGQKPLKKRKSKKK